MVTDDGGAAGSDSLRLTVVNLPPVVRAALDAVAGTADTFVAHGLAFDAGRKPVTVAVDFGDGTPAAAIRPRRGQRLRLHPHLRPRRHVPGDGRWRRTGTGPVRRAPSPWSSTRPRRPAPAAGPSVGFTDFVEEHFQPAARKSRRPRARMRPTWCSSPSRSRPRPGPSTRSRAGGSCAGPAGRRGQGATRSAASGTTATTRSGPGWRRGSRRRPSASRPAPRTEKSSPMRLGGRRESPGRHRSGGGVLRPPRGRGSVVGRRCHAGAGRAGARPGGREPRAADVPPRPGREAPRRTRLVASGGRLSAGRGRPARAVHSHASPQPRFPSTEVMRCSLSDRTTSTHGRTHHGSADVAGAGGLRPVPRPGPGRGADPRRPSTPCPTTVRGWSTTGPAPARTARRSRGSCASAPSARRRATA